MKMIERSQCEEQKRFMQAMGSPTVAKDGIIKALGLAEKLIMEEVNSEMLPALRKYVASQSLENLTELADGIVDSVYVIFQLANALDLPFDRLFAEVHSSNMAKLQPDGTVLRREDGKVLKPPGWMPPMLHAILLEWSTQKEYGDNYMRNQHV